MTSAAGTVGRLVRQSVKLDRSGVELGFGVRCTIGVAIPLVLALLAGQPLSGVSAAFGAMSAGFASRQGVYRTRAAAMLLTTLGMAFSGYVGCHVGSQPILGVGLIAGWGLALGLLGSLGTAATTVGTNSVLALIIFSHPPYDPAIAPAQAGFIVAGGVLQTVLLVLVWPLQRFSGERRVLAAAYHALAAYAGGLPESALASPATAELTTVGTALADPQPFARRSELVGFTELLNEAERIRATLGALATDRHHLALRGLADGAAAVRDLGAGARAVLDAIADALAAGRAPAENPAGWSALDRGLERLEAAGAAAGAGGAADAAAAVGDARALLGQLRAAWRAGQLPEDRPAASAARPHAVAPFGTTALGDALETLRANCSPRSVYAQHALRLAVTLGLAALAEHVLPLQRGYWIPLTAVLVLRPDFTSTFTRGASRVGGTVAGAVVASALAGLHPAPAAYLLLAVAFAAAGFTLFAVNYGIYSITVTAYVVFLLAFGGSPEHVAALDRVGATLLGGALALAAYAVWPTWSRARVPLDLADLLDAQRGYASLVLRAFLDPSRADPDAIRTAQRAAWLARSNAEASVDAMSSEPVRPKAVGERAALAVLAASRRFGVASLTLQARLGRAAGIAHGTLARLADDLESALDAIAGALRHGSAPPPLPPLRDAQIALKRALDRNSDPQLGALVSETDLMVDSTNAMAEALR